MKVIILNNNKKIKHYYHNFGKFILNPPLSPICIKFKNLNNLSDDNLNKIGLVLAQARSIKNINIKCSLVGVCKEDILMQIIIANQIPYHLK